jgi:hypothetical protein
MFIGLTGQDIIAGACTLNKRTHAKIKADLTTIFGSGEKPTHVIYFCESDIPVSTRHNLKKHCEETYTATLDIFDGQAIADMLADRKAFWIAEQFLEIPADSWPKSSLDEHYTSLRDRWVTRKPTPQNYADFLEIKQGLRTATFQAEAKADLGGWIAAISLFLADDIPDALQQKARYEIAVAELRGNGSLDPAFPLIQAFFDILAPDRPPAELLDGAVLMVYCWSAPAQGQMSVAPGCIATWLRKIDEVLAQARSDNDNRGDQCTILEGQAMLGFIPRGSEPPAEIMDNFFKLWAQVVRQVKRTPLFPVSHIADILEILSSFIGTDERLRALTNDIDKLIGERAGKGAAAERARRRAVAHLDAGRYVAAIDELQHSKTGWYTGEDIDGSVLAMLAISQAYETLGLHFASRYYAAGALFVSINQENEDLTPRISQAAFRIATTFYTAGEGVTFLRSLGVALSIHQSVATNADNWEQHPQIQHGLLHAAILRAVARRLAPDLVPVIDAAIEGWPLQSRDRDALIALSEGEPWSVIPITEIEANIARDLGQHPFGDIGPERAAAWSAFGVIWTVHSTADEETWIAALEVAAALQIVQVEFADADLLVIPSQVVIFVDLQNIESPKFWQLPDNGSLAWRITIPKSPELTWDRAGAALASLVITILGQATGLPAKKFQNLAKERVERGLPMRLYSVRSMRELMKYALPEGLDLVCLASLTRPKLLSPMVPIEVAELRWRTGPGPGYSKRLAQRHLESRYAHTRQALRLTLPRLLSDDRCRDLLRNFKSQGLLDWQILTVLANLVGQWQIEQQLQHPLTPQAIHEAGMQRLLREERVDDPVFDPDYLTADRLEMYLRILTAAAFQTWGLESHRSAPDFNAMKRLLDERYGHSTDDIPHENPFADLSAELRRIIL